MNDRLSDRRLLHWYLLGPILARVEELQRERGRVLSKHPHDRQTSGQQPQLRNPHPLHTLLASLLPGCDLENTRALEGIADAATRHP